MSVQAEYFLAGMELLTDGTYDITGAALAIALMDPDDYVSLGLDATPITFDDGVEAGIIDTLNIGSQTWTYDSDTRTRVLVPDSDPTWTPGAPESFRFAVLYDTDNAHAPFVQFTWPETQSVPDAVLHTLDIPYLMAFRMYANQSPAPLGGVQVPVVLQDVDGINWRLMAIGGVLDTATTAEVGVGDVYLTSPDTTLWRLEVDNTGVVTTVGGGTPGELDRIFDDISQPCLLPAADPTSPYILSVDDTGDLSVA